MPKPGCGKRSGHKVNTLLEEGVEGNGAIVSDRSGGHNSDVLLCNACWFNRAETARSIATRMGATAAGHFGAKQLIRAARHGNVACVELLIEHGVRITDGRDSGGGGDGGGNFRNGSALNSGQLALLEACEHAHVDVAALLVAHGARVNGRRGADAVHAACTGVGGRRAVELVRLLAQHGARVSDDAFYAVLATADMDPHAYRGV